MQVIPVNDPNNDLIGDRIFEELSKHGFIVGLSKNSELKEMKTEMFDKFLMFYPTVHGAETAETRPAFQPKLVSAIPIIGWIIGKNVIASYTYDDRQAAINLHCRLVSFSSKTRIGTKRISTHSPKADQNPSCFTLPILKIFQMSRIKIEEFGETIAERELQNGKFNLENNIWKCY